MKLTFHFLLLEFPNQEFSVLQFCSGNFLKPLDESQSLEGKKINAGIFALKIDKNVLTWTTLFYEQKTKSKNKILASPGEDIVGAVPPPPLILFWSSNAYPLPPLNCRHHLWMAPSVYLRGDLTG